MKTQLELSPTDYRFLRKIYNATGIESRYSVLNGNDFLEQTNRLDNNRESSQSTNQNKGGFDKKLFPTTKARMLMYKKHALNLALEAIEDCLKNLAGFDLQSITHVITVSCTGMYAPGLDIEIIEKLQLSSQTHRTCVNFMGCYGVFSALKMAKSICKASTKAKVLIVSVELCSLHLQKQANFKDNIIASALFGDGAAATLIENEASGHSYLALNDFYCDIISAGKQDMAWEIGDFGFEINLSAFVPKLIQHGIKDFMENALRQFDLTKEEIHYYAIHPGSQKILQTCDEALNVSENQSACSYDILKNYGNMSSATILFVLKQLWTELKKKRVNANIFSCGFGPGLTIESMVLKHHFVSVH